MAKKSQAPGEQREHAIIAKRVSKSFRLPHERHDNLKSLILKFYKTEHGFELQKALNNVSFEIFKGDFFGIVGRNGSGKSTMLKLLAGIYSPTKGEIHVAGKLIPFIELGVGFNPELSGRENVYLNGALLGFTRKEMEAMYDEIVDFAELERFMDQRLKNYSSGMQVRLAFSIAIRARGDILLLDEVLAVGDAAFQQKCFDYFEELKKQNKTVVFVSHDMSSVRRFCNRAVYLRDGKLILAGTPEEVADLYIADNIRHEVDVAGVDDPKLPDSNKVAIDIEKETKNQITVKFSYKSKETLDMYAAMSIIMNGVSVAEITTPPEITLQGNGILRYTLDLSVFNPGVYQITGVICKKDTRELLAVSKAKPKFYIKGADATKGGAIKLEHTWK